MKTLDQIKTGLSSAEFFLEYMPTISLNDNNCIGAEALIRWQFGDELIPPDEFISIVENTAVSGLMTCWIIEQVARELGDWLRKHNNVHIGINIPPDVIGRGNLEYAATNAGLIDIADKLIIEITERGFPDEQALEALKLKGKTRVAIDDFGTGDANIMQMSQMNADIIKLDKYFVDQITSENNVPKIVKGLIAFAHAMDFEIIAEGIETDIQARTLKSLGTHMAQGWLYSKPLNAADFINFHREHNTQP
jgi:sensor c-di-GMP phosphodiesterase-like protein